MALVDADKLAVRAANLGAFNGLKRVLVSLSGGDARLDVELHNANGIPALLADPRPPHQIFPISGGHRLPAGASAGFVKVVQILPSLQPNALVLQVTPIGDYSTYTLSVEAPFIDPIFGEIDFKFRPGCFSIDCAPEWTGGAARPEPAIDYLAKDYESFRHTLIGAMQDRVPGWTPTSEADLSVVLIDLLSAGADELSDYQDRVMNEAYLGSTRKRVSLARHARLVDYAIDPGNQAHTTIAVELAAGQTITLGRGFVAWTGEDQASPDAALFVTRDAPTLSHHLNAIGLYTW